MVKIKRLIWLGMTLGVAGILTGCATTANVKEIKALPTEKTESFVLSSMSLEVIDKTPGQNNQKFIQPLEEELKKELTNNGFQVDPNAENILKVALTKISIVTVAKRLLLGIFGGQTSLETEVVLTDKTGASLTEFKVTSNAGIRGALFEADSIQRTTKKLAQEIVSRLKSLKNQK